MRKKPKEASKKIRKKLKSKERPMFQLIIDALRDCHQHIIKAPLCKEEIHDMESTMLRSAGAYMNDPVLEVWLVCGKEFQQMMIKDALGGENVYQSNR